MRPTTQEKIIAYIRKKNQASPKELAEFLQITPAALFRHLKSLQEKGSIIKKGRSPRTYYALLQQPALSTPTFPSTTEHILADEFLIITPDGILREGKDAFVYWCQTHQLEPLKTATEYLRTLQKYHAYKKDSLIDGTQKLQNTFQDHVVDRMLYIDFYSIERFGKTKLGTLLLYAKQAQSKELIAKIVAMIQPTVITLIQKEQIDAICFIPPTIPRKVQLMKELKDRLALPLPTIHIEKILQDVPVAQKTLSRLQDRIENAKNTIIVREQTTYRNILLIDDAMGSGATMHETAKKIKEQGICTGKVIGLALTGSYKGFDVITEV